MNDTTARPEETAKVPTQCPIRVEIAVGSTVTVSARKMPACGAGSWSLVFSPAGPRNMSEAASETVWNWAAVGAGAPLTVKPVSFRLLQSAFDNASISANIVAAPVVVLMSVRRVKPFTSIQTVYCLNTISSQLCQLEITL